MPRSPGSPEAWMDFARSDLAVARSPSHPDVMLEALCFHAQQAAEKCVKAVLVSYGIRPPKTRSIQRLIDLLPLGVPCSAEVASATALTAYATTFRYPSDEDAVTGAQHREARLASAVFAWAEAQVRHP